MKVSLLYSSDAGEGVTESFLVEKIESAGHRLVEVVEKGSEFDGVFRRPCDLVVAAGGDGTVHAAARALRGRGGPSLAILPLGTANNIARSLKIGGSIAELARGWASNRRVAFDFGRVSAGWIEERCFLEGVGGGLLPAAITAAKRARLRGPTDVQIRSALELFSQTLERVAPLRVEAIVDGSRLEGDFVLWEVLNIPFAGPNLPLSPSSDPTDGALEVTVARDRERNQLADCLRRQLDGSGGSISLPTRRAKHVEIRGLSSVRVDDEVLSGPAGESISIRIEPAAIEVLV